MTSFESGSCHVLANKRAVLKHQDSPLGMRVSGKA